MSNRHKPIRPQMGEAIMRALTHSRGELVRVKGGFWTYEGCSIAYLQNETLPVPCWRCAPATIKALVDARLAIVTETRARYTRGAGLDRVATRIKIVSRKRGDGSWWT